MPRDQLLGLASATDRLLAAGAATVPGHDGLTLRAKSLRRLAKKAPSVAPVADAAEKAAAAPPRKAPAALLDLIAVGRQLRASLAAPGLVGDFVPAPPSGPWPAPLLTRDVFMLYDALSRRLIGRDRLLRMALEQNIVADLRLTDPLLSALAVENSFVARLIAEMVLPAQGPGVAAPLRAALNLKGKTADVRRLTALMHADPAAADVCRRALAGGNPALRARALAGLRAVGRPEEIAAAALAHCTDKAASVRSVAYEALADVPTDAALDALVTALGRERDLPLGQVQIALRRIAHPGTVARLITVLPGLIDALTTARAATAPAERERTTAIGRVQVVFDVLKRRSDGCPGALAAVLLPLAQGKNPQIAGWAVAALGRAASAPGVLDLLRKLARADGQYSDTALDALEALPHGLLRSILPELVADTVRQAGAFRERLIGTLLPFFATDPDLVRPAVRAVLSGPTSTRSFTYTVFQLGKFGPDVAEFLPLLLDAVKRDSPGNFWWYSELLKIDPEGRTVPAALLPLLASNDNQVVWRVARCLGDYAISGHLPALAALADHPDGSVRAVAQRAASSLNSSAAAPA